LWIPPPAQHKSLKEKQRKRDFKCATTARSSTPNHNNSTDNNNNNDDDKNKNKNNNIAAVRRLVFESTARAKGPIAYNVTHSRRGKQ